MKKTYLLFLLALPISLLAQYTQTSDKTIGTVAGIKDLKDDANVVLEGKIEKHLGGDKYTFTDNTGAITVDIDNDDWKGQKISTSDTIRIAGEVDKAIFGTKIDVKTVTLVKASDDASALVISVPEKVSVSQVKDLKDDTNVVLEGKIEKHLGGDKYTFTDSTGSITVDIDEKNWGGEKVGPTDTVRITGEVDKDLFSTKIDVKTVERVSR